MTLSQRLVKVREENGYTRKRLSEELGKPYATITKYETGEREPGHSYIVEIAKKFGVSADYILGIDDNTERKNPQPYRLRPKILLVYSILLTRTAKTWSKSLPNANTPAWRRKPRLIPIWRQLPPLKLSPCSVPVLPPAEASPISGICGRTMRCR